MIGVTAEGDLTALAEKIAGISEVAYVVVTAGSFDLLVEAVVEDDERLLDLVNDRLRPRCRGVRTTETFIYSAHPEADLCLGCIVTGAS